MDSNIKNKVLQNEILQQILNGINDPQEKEKTIQAINSLLEDFQKKADNIMVSYKESINKDDAKKNENK